MLSKSSASSSDIHVGSMYPMEIPESMTSAAALRYVGFTDNQASVLFDTWSAASDCPWDLEQTAIKIIKGSNIDAEAIDDDWEGVMVACKSISESWPPFTPRQNSAFGQSSDTDFEFLLGGIKQSLRTAILNPEFSDIRSTRSAKFWVSQSIARGFSSLELIYHASHEGLIRSEHDINAMRRHESQFPAPLRPVIPLREGMAPPATAESQGTPGFTVLYKGMDIKDTEDLIDDGTRQYSCHRLADGCPTDFHGPNAWISYFGVERRVAEKYAQYIKHLVPFHRTCIVEMTIANSLIDRMNPVILRYGEDWKKIVWNSRRGSPYPKELRYLFKQPLYIGDICHTWTPAISKMPSWNELTRKNVVTVEEKSHGQNGQMTTVTKPGTQYAFFGDDMADLLTKECSFGILRSIAG